MPRLQDIERFKHDLAALSHEAEILARWGERPMDVTAPDGSTDSEVPAGARSETVRRPPRGAPEPEEGLPPDFATLLDNLPLDIAPEEEAPGAGEDLGMLLEPLEELDEETEPAPPEEGSATEPEEFALPSTEPEFDLESFALPESEEGETAPARAADFGEEALPPGETGLESFEAADFEVPGGISGEAFGESPPVAEVSEPSAESVFEPEPEAEAVFEPEQASEAEPEPEEPETSGALEEAEQFGIPDLGDFDFGTESAPRPRAEASADEFSIPEMEWATEPAMETAEEFSLTSPGESESTPEEGFSFGESAETEAAPAGDGFDSFAFEEGAGAEPGLGGDLDAEIAALSTEVGPGETFSLDQEWGGFGAETAPPRQTPPRIQAPRPSRAAPEENVRPVALSEAQVDRLQDSLLSYPLNLRVAIEDILANEKGSEAQQSRLIWSMVEDASAEEAALLAGRILKRRIEIPRGFEKKTGAAMEAEKGSFRYAFVHTVLPALRIGAAAALAAVLLGWLGWRYIYTPLAADALYRTGYHRIAEDRYAEADESFDKATSMREFIVWYYRYAEAYAAKKQYILAENKYATLIERHPRERSGILAWARLEREQLKYEEAVQVLQGVPQPLARVAPTEAQRGKTGLLSWDYYNKEGLILLGDIYLDWGDEDSARFEDARRTYAMLIQHYGYQDPYLERMLLYFIRSDGKPGPDGKLRDNLGEILPLKKRFLGERSNPLSPAVTAELGGYLLDRNILDDVRTMLLAAAKKDPALPEAHYQLVRYFQRAGDPDQERVALDNAVKTFAALTSLTPRQTAMYLDSLIWRGNYRVAAREWIGAEQDFTTAATAYEQALELRRLNKQPRFGQAYAGLATVAFWQRNDLDEALSLLERAADSGYDTADTRYRRGYILFQKGRFADSLEQFYLAGGDGTESPYLGFAFGTALYERGDYLSAEAYFRRVVDAMKRQLASIDLLQPGQSPSQAEILELLMKADNNLGAALLRSAATIGDARRRSAAATPLTSSSQLHDQLVATGIPLGAEPRDLASINLAQAIKGPLEPAPLVYSELERAMPFPRAGLDALAMNEEMKLARE